MSFTPSTYSDVQSVYNDAYATDNKKSSACDSKVKALKKATAFAWKQPVLTKKRKNADKKVADAAKALAACRKADRGTKDSKKSAATSKTRKSVRKLVADTSRHGQRSRIGAHGASHVGRSAAAGKGVGRATATAIRGRLGETHHRQTMSKLSDAIAKAKARGSKIGRHVDSKGHDIVSIDGSEHDFTANGVSDLDLDSVIPVEDVEFEPSDDYESEDSDESDYGATAGTSSEEPNYLLYGGVALAAVAVWYTKFRKS